jgi:cytochrome c oxidase subunit 4
VLVALFALAVATLAISYIDLHRWNLVVAMAIAVSKMMLVVLFFMHGLIMPRVSKLAFATGFFWLGILVALTLSDYFTRIPSQLPG